MGKPRKKRNDLYKTLHQQAYNIMYGMLAIGKSKRDAILAGTYFLSIFAWGTFHTYMRHIDYFLKYIKDRHPECTTLRRCRRYIREWLQYRESQGLSAWTIHTDAKALGKLYQIRPGDPDYCRPPSRLRKDVKRSRDGNAAHKNFSEVNNADLIIFNQGTGLRRSELGLTYPEHLYTREIIRSETARIESIPKNRRTKRERQYLDILRDVSLFPNEEYFVYVPRGKGGRQRICPIIGPHADQIVARYQNTAPGTKLWPHIHSGANIHGYRADYAVALYKAYARPISEIPYDAVNKGSGYKYQSEVYTCRNDMAGVKLDRAAMHVTSRALGHNRDSVIAGSYLYKL